MGIDVNHTPETLRPTLTLLLHEGVTADIKSLNKLYKRKFSIKRLASTVDEIK